jgi:beta-lactamase regulating signal transducer with metallopeptidase domain
MSLWLMTPLAVLSTITAVVGASSLAVAVVAPKFVARLERRLPAERAAGLLRLRILPIMAALQVGVGGVLPLFIWFEPREGHERIPITLVMAAGVAVWLVARLIWRAGRSVLATERLMRKWAQLGTPVTSFESPFPVFAIDDTFPTIALTGLRRPVLFIAARVLEECSADELRAIIAHEAAHLRARDNLKRLLLQSFPALGHVERQLDRAWMRASEEAADAAAARAPALTLPLAQALVHVARLASRRNLAVPASLFHAGGEIEARVRRLLNPHDDPPPTTVFGSGLTTVLAGIGLFAVLGAAPGIHQFFERVIAVLP